MSLRKTLIAALAALVLASGAFAQNRTTFAAVRNAYDYAYGINPSAAALQIYGGTNVTGAATVTVSFGYTVAADGTTFYPLSVVAPITVGSGSNAETITPSAVSCQQPTVYGSCSFTATFANIHGTGDNVSSGTVGLQEAVNLQKGGGQVALTPGWAMNGGTNAMLAAAVGYGQVPIQDNRGFGVQYYGLRGNATSITTAPAAPTNALITGSLTSGVYYTSYECVDPMGNLSLPATDSTQTTTATGVTITLPASACSGAVGYIPFITAASGATGSEIAVPVTSTVCTVTPIETVIPACAIANTNYGVTSTAVATVTANPSGTMAEINSQSTNYGLTAYPTPYRTVYGYQAFATLPAQFSAAFGIPAVASGTATGTYEVGMLNLPSGYLNSIGKKARVCFSGHDTFGGTNGQTLSFQLYYGPYNNSDTSLATLTTAAGTPTTGIQVAQGCFELTVASTGATGSLWAHGALTANVATSGTAVAGVYQDGNGTVKSSLPLSTQQQMRLALTVGAQALATGGFVMDSFSLEPVN